MSRITNPVEKKQLAYARDHYNRNGESNKGWRKIKPLKKAINQRASRRITKALLQHSRDEEEQLRKLSNVKRRKVLDWGSIHLREFVANRKLHRLGMIGARKKRQALRIDQLMRLGVLPP
jgi:hypothetical protein